MIWELEGSIPATNVLRILEKNVQPIFLFSLKESGGHYFFLL